MLSEGCTFCGCIVSQRDSIHPASSERRSVSPPAYFFLILSYISIKHTFTRSEKTTGIASSHRCVSRLMPKCWQPEPRPALPACPMRPKRQRDRVTPACLVRTASEFCRRYGDSIDLTWLSLTKVYYNLNHVAKTPGRVALTTARLQAILATKCDKNAYAIDSLSHHAQASADHG